MAMVARAQSPDRSNEGVLAPTGPSRLARPGAALGNQAHLRRLQAKLTIGAVDDPLEREADAAADVVMRMADPAVSPSAGPPVLSRKCADCEDEEKEHPVQRDARGGALPGGGAAAPPVVDEVLAAPGRPLEPAMHDFMSSRFGADFSDVRVHADAAAAQSALEVGALAYTVGSHIVFGAGRYDPAGEGGGRLLAHELAHVVQQSGRPTSLRRFGSEEHVKIGDNAAPGQTVDLGPDVGKATFGEMIALGDYFASVSEIITEANDTLFGADEVKIALWKVNPAARVKPVVGQNVEDAVMARYYDLASKNQTHFSTGSEPGKSNREQYIAMHQRAIGNAYSQGSNGVILGISWEGWEGFGQHFLTDAFSAGHVRTPRHEIQAFWNSKYPNFSDNLLDMIACYMAAYINDRDSVGWVKTVPGLVDEIKPILRAKAGSALSAFAFGDMISKVLHDTDNMGLDVVSPAGLSGPGSTGWRDIGDGNLYSAQASPQMQAAQLQTQQMVEEASRRSFAEAQAAFSAGSKRSGNLNDMMDPKTFRALELIPSQNKPTATPMLDWKAKDIPSLGAGVQAGLFNLFAPGQEIGDQIRGFKVECVTTKSSSVGDWDLHTWEAWVCFRNTLLRDIIGTLDRIATGDTCPPGNDNPCGTVTTPCP